MGAQLSIPWSSIFSFYIVWSGRQRDRRYRLLAIQDNRVRVIQIRHTWKERKKAIISTVMIATALALVTYMVVMFRHNTQSAHPNTGPPIRWDAQCDTPEQGFICDPQISHSWGQYSPYYSVPSEIDSAIPHGCEVTFAQVLSRHGARDPTLGKTLLYKILLEGIRQKVKYYGFGYGFLKDYNYTLGADQLTLFGENQMVNSGIKFYNRYQALARRSVPFLRASGQDRVVQSAEKFTEGYDDALRADKSATAPHPLPYDMLIIPESAASNNTMSHGLCTAFESPSDYYSLMGTRAQGIYASTFIQPILTRLNANLKGYDFTESEVIYLMDLCPFTSVAAPYEPTNPSSFRASPFCNLFTPHEWTLYDYYQTLGKWYGYGPGNPLGPTQGVGYVNELIARITARPVDDHTSTNSTLDHDPRTFPLDRKLYADFSHDNDMVSILGALRLYDDETLRLRNETRMEEKDSGGFSSRWTVPFAGRIYFERMKCGADDGIGGEEFVRILVNDRVMKLRGCGVDGVGRCTVDKWVQSLEFARTGGRWDICFAD